MFFTYNLRLVMGFGFVSMARGTCLVLNGLYCLFYGD